MRGYRVRLQRLVVTEIDINADTPGEAIVGAMTTVLSGSYPDDMWVAMPLNHKTVRQLGAPISIPLIDARGADALTTEPERPPQIPPNGLELVDDEPPIPEDGLYVGDIIGSDDLPDGSEIDDDGPPIPEQGLDVQEGDEPHEADEEADEDDT